MFAELEICADLTIQNMDKNTEQIPVGIVVQAEEKELLEIEVLHKEKLASVLISGLLRELVADLFNKRFAAFMTLELITEESLASEFYRLIELRLI